MLNIRKARSEDASTMLELVKALADYEKASHEVEATEADFLRDGFGEDPLFRCLIAEWNGTPVGLALHFFTWSTWTGRPTLYLEDLFVLPEYRGKGIGMALLKACAKIAVEKNCKRFEWAVLDWNTPARDFYHAIGAFHKETWLPYRLEGEALKNLAET